MVISESESKQEHKRQNSQFMIRKLVSKQILVLQRYH